MDKIEKCLLIISRSNPQSHFLSQITKKNVKKVVYAFEKASLDDILSFVIAELGGQKVDALGFIIHATDSEMHLAGVGNTVLSCDALIKDRSLREFFQCLSSTFMNVNKACARIDFLNSQLTNESEAVKLSNALQKITHCLVQVHRGLTGPDAKSTPGSGHKKKMSVMELYFLPDKLEEFLNSSMHSQIQNLSGYERIRTVGKGAFGTAVLYRKKCDDSLVIVKEINMHDLTASERQLAINEVSVLSLLNHENIVSYYDSFEEDGVLMIEMEYADGGNLAQYLQSMRVPIDEKDILLLFKQIVSAIKHMHDHHILHRDLKTANIFLTKNGTVKVGDFGISKMLTTRQGGAMTVVGTPYYISPEMCEGKLYNQKSDIWALGCILYEMACQQKTFEGSNLPALVNKIVKGQFAPVKGNYSPGFKHLIQDLLQRDPDLRPTAADILYRKLPPLLEVYETKDAKEYDDNEISMDFNYQGQSPSRKNSISELRSVLYDVQVQQEDISLTPIPLPPRSKIKEVAVSSTHTIVLTLELLVYTWGDGRKGQLGFESLDAFVEKPRCVDSLKGKNISRICAGEFFSLFASDSGIVMTCGEGTYGCLGHGDWNSCVKPKLIERLLSVDVCAVSCGPHHVVVVGIDGDVFSWGAGAGGRLGTGREEDCCSPTQVVFPNDLKIVQAHCGLDGSMFITDRGSLLACGMNTYNKLGLNEQRGFLHWMRKAEVAKQCVPTKLSWLRQIVISVSMGAVHTAVLIDPGKLITFGCNRGGQLGRGTVRGYSTPAVVKSMADHTITMVQCGDTFTIAGTAENTIYFWGSRQVPSKSRTIRSLSKIKPKIEVLDVRRFSDTEYASDISETSFASEVIKIDGLGDSFLDDRDLVLQPKEILALYASPAQIARGQIVSLANLFCFGGQVLLVVDTTAPIPKPPSKNTNAYENFKNVVQAGLPPIGYEKPSVPDEDSLGPVPEWLKNELANAPSAKPLKTTKIEVHDIKKSKTNQSKTAQKIKVKPYPHDKAIIVKDTGAGNTAVLSKELIDIKSTPAVLNDRERELEIQIEELKEELKKYKGAPEVAKDYKDRQDSRKRFWPRRNRSSRHLRSKICSLQ